MPKVSFLQENISVEVPEKTPLIEVIEKSGSHIPFGCRRGSCGTCRIHIKNGAQSLNSLTEAERDLFATLMHVASDERLACQLTIQSGDVEILG